MKELSIFIVAIWAFGLILLPQLAHAEMSALTDEQMGEGYLVSPWNLSLTVDLETERNMQTETDDLLDDIEEIKLNTYLQGSSAPYSKEYFKIFERNEDRTTIYDYTISFDAEGQFKPADIHVYEH